MKSLKNLEELIISRFKQPDQDLLGELPNLKLFYVHEIDAKLFSGIIKEYGRRMEVYYRGLKEEYAKNRIRIPDFLTPECPYGDLKKEYSFREDDLEIYHGQFEQTGEEIHFYRDFYINDSCRQIEHSFFRRFVDVDTLYVDKNALSKDELIGILSSFLNVQTLNFLGKTNCESDVYQKLIPTVCPYIRHLIINDNLVLFESCRKEIQARNQKQRFG